MGCSRREGDWESIYSPGAAVSDSLEAVLVVAEYDTGIRLPCSEDNDIASGESRYATNILEFKKGLREPSRGSTGTTWIEAGDGDFGLD